MNTSRREYQNWMEQTEPHAQHAYQKKRPSEKHVAGRIQALRRGTRMRLRTAAPSSDPRDAVQCDYGVKVALREYDRLVWGQIKSYAIATRADLAVRTQSQRQENQKGNRQW